MRINIIFNQLNKPVLESAQALSENLLGDIVVIEDDYAQGPITPDFDNEQNKQRIDWWANILSENEYEQSLLGDLFKNLKKVESLKEFLLNNKEAELWIWAAQNKNDVCGYYWLISQLKDFQGQIHILYLNNLPFINEKGQIFYPTRLNDILPSEFLKAMKLARPITTSEFEIDADEWTKLCNEHKNLRLLDGGKKIIQFDEDYFDKDLLNLISNEYIKLSKVINLFNSKNKDPLTEQFITWRIRYLISNGILQLKGKENSKEFEIAKS